MHRRDVLLLVSPALFLLHEVEEYFTMLPWVRANGAFLPDLVRARLPDDPAFILQVGVLLFVAFLAVAIICTRSVASRWPWTLFAILVLARLENSVGHIAMAAIFRGYTFGVITAALIVFPVSVLLVRQMVRRQVVQRASLPSLAGQAFAVQVFVLAAVFLVYYR